MEEDRERCDVITTKHFQGLVGITEPKKSWIARWQRVVSMIPGVYAIKERRRIARLKKSRKGGEGLREEEKKERRREEEKKELRK